MLSDMNKLKSAYELASERMIAPRYSKKIEEDALPDFIDIPEFSDREDRVLEQDGSNETKLFTEQEREQEEHQKEKIEEVKVEEPQRISFDDKPLEVYWNGQFMDYGGFARMNRIMVFGLSNRNVKIKVEIEPSDIHINKETQKEIKRMSNTRVSPTAPKVFGVTVPMNLSYSGKKIIYTMIETSEKVHHNYSGKLNLTDEIWVATDYGKRILEKSNVHPPIHVMPLGVDVSRYSPEAGLMNLGSSMRKFKFLSVFRWSYRKGFDILLRSYMEEFSGDEDVSLVLVSRAVECPEEISTQKIQEDFENIKETINKSEKELPHIALYGRTIHEKDMSKLYNAADAFVLISRGEGFGLPYIEAGATGLPVIASNCSGHTDFLNEDNSYLVEPDVYVTATINGKLSRMAKLCHFYEEQIFPDFGRNAIEKTKEHMRYVYENYKEAKIKARKLRKLIVNNYTWEMAVDRVYKRLSEISQRD